MGITEAMTAKTHWHGCDEEIPLGVIYSGGTDLVNSVVMSYRPIYHQPGDSNQKKSADSMGVRRRYLLEIGLVRNPQVVVRGFIIPPDF
jgi:hypothetical protein